MEEFEVKLPSGHVQKGRAYKAEGSKKNLLIMTGMEEHSARYEDFALFLNGKGFDVYVLDAVGQGLNAPNPDDQMKWYPNAFDENVTAANIKIEELKKEKPTSLMGHSMGSFMTQRYLELFPNTVERAVLCGSNGPNGIYGIAHALASLRTNEKNFDKTDAFMEKLGLGGYSKAIKDAKTPCDWLSYNEENVQKYIADPYCGHPATHGFWKEFTGTMSKIYKKDSLAKVSLDEHLLLIAGEEDPVGGAKGVGKLEEMYKKLGVKDVTKIIYPHMRHEILNENDKQVVYDDVAKVLLA